MQSVSGLKQEATLTLIGGQRYLQHGKGIEMRKAKSLSQLKREADRVFSLYIRKRDGRCVICGSRENLTNGHLIGRRIMSLRWDELNCHTQCWGCNFRHRYRPEIFTNWFVQRHGQNVYSILVVRSGEFKQWKKYELEAIVEKYKRLHDHFMG